MTTPFPFQSAAVLLASQLNAITTLVTSTKTASHTLTIADVSTRVIMNSASATTITVNTSIFGASDIVEILNIGAGVCTITAGTCTVGTSGTLALAQNAGGKLTFISASASVFQADGVAAAAASGLTFITGASFSSATAVNVNNCFTSTYRNYAVFLNVDSIGTAGFATMRLRVGGTDNSSSNYYWSGTYIVYSNAQVNGEASLGTTTSFNVAYCNLSTASQILVFDPQTANATMFASQIINKNTNSGHYAGNMSVTTQFDGFSLVFATAATGAYKVYGYANS